MVGLRHQCKNEIFAPTLIQFSNSNLLLFSSFFVFPATKFMDSGAVASVWGQDDDCELYNDDGFVYKRKKRRLGPASSLPAVTENVDPEAEVNRRRERKRVTLLKLKAVYQEEIDQWELLSRTLREMEEKSRKIQEQQQRERLQEQTTTFSEGTFLTDDQEKVYSGGSIALVDDLLLQAEAQEAIMQNTSNLCDIAEALCATQEGLLNQSFIDLPIWDSPRELMASLCEE